jgi:hypothetical protein
MGCTDTNVGLAVEGLWKAWTAWLPLFKGLAYLTALRQGRQPPRATERPFRVCLRYARMNLYLWRGSGQMVRAGS